MIDDIPLQEYPTKIRGPDEDGITEVHTSIASEVGKVKPTIPNNNAIHILGRPFLRPLQEGR